MNRLKIYFVASMFLLLSGCSAAKEQVLTEDTDRAVQSDNLEPTEDEIEVLCKTYAGEERIREGKLYGYQKAQLKRMRYAQEYLTEKYPDKEFKISYCSEKADTNYGWEFGFYELSNADEIYKVCVEEDDIDGYIAVDNFYKTLLQPRYDEWLSNEFTEIIEQPVYTYTVFSFMEGRNLSGLEDMDYIMELGESLHRVTYIYTAASSRSSELLKKLYDYVQENNLYGGYHFYSDDEIMSLGETGAEVLAKINGADKYYDNISFQTWNKLE